MFNLDYIGSQIDFLKNEVDALDARLVELQNAYTTLTSHDRIFTTLPTWDGVTSNYQFGGYITEQSADGPARDAAVMDLVDFVADAKVFNTVPVFCNFNEINDGTIPLYIKEKGLAWQCDTINLLYELLSTPNFNTYVQKAHEYGAYCFIVDDAHNYTAAELETIFTQIRLNTDRPLLATFSATYDIPGGGYDSMSPAIDIFFRQYYRQGESTSLMNTWWAAHTPHDGINLECYNAPPMTSAADMRDMFDRLEVLGCNNYVTYAFFDETTDLRNRPDQWAMHIGLGLKYWNARNP